MDYFKGLFNKKEPSSGPQRQSSVKYVLTQGHTISDVDPVGYAEKECSVCNRPADVVRAPYTSLSAFMRAGGRGAYYPASIAVRGQEYSLPKSSKDAGYCETCGKSFHFHCVENVRLAGGIQFNCPLCRRSLAPLPEETEG